MPALPAARRLFIWAAPPIGLGALALAAKTFTGTPGWAAALIALAGVVSRVLPALLPQESEHRRDVWRDWLRHRERMARMRMTNAEAHSHHEPSD